MKFRNSQTGGAHAPSRVAGAALVPGGERHDDTRRGIFREGAENRHARARVLPVSQRGVALVLTLIMLAIITVVVVVFLATARRNRSATTVRKDQTDAELAGEAAYHHASARIIVQILRDRDLLSLDFLVSSPLSSPPPIVTNRPQDIAPFRPWPFASTNHRPYNFDEIPIVANRTGSVDVYLDLNRNRQFDDPRPYGDPIWLGVLEKPWTNHVANNRFIARFAYAVIPTGKALDLNTIHNQASPNNGFKFSRNQGFGPWELNLAAFLAELSPTNWWVSGAQAEYGYGPFPKPIATGMAFEDARSIVDYRNAWGRDQSPRRLMDTFPAAFGAPFPLPSIDAYADGNAGVVLGANPFFADDDTPTKLAWSGADTTNHFFDIQDLFHVTNNYSPNQVTPQFYNNLSNAVANDPSAYYRLIAQLATDTGSDYHDRINLNYVAVGTNTAADFAPWDASPALAVAFFTNVAERIFRAQSNEFNNLSTNQIPLRSITQIPIYPTNLYSTAIHRILQEAANIFDATREKEFPSVFLPSFASNAALGVFISGFTADNTVTGVRSWLATNDYGVPAVIGAKKGFPNFNEFTLRSDILVSRKLEVQRSSLASFPPSTFATNQMYVLGISNYFGVEAWHSYAQQFSPYPRRLDITVSNYAVMLLTNNLGFQRISNVTVAAVTTVTNGTWRGGETLGFRLPFNTSTVFLSNGVYRFTGNSFVDVGLNSFERALGATPLGPFPLPYWVLTVSNRLSYLMEDNGRVVDFVLLTDSQSVDLYRDLVAGTDPYATVGAPPTLATLWNTNRSRGPNGPTDGILRQMDIALGNVPTANADWRAYALTRTGTEDDKNSAIAAFRNFCGLAQISSIPFTSNTTLAMQAPFNPAARVAVLSTWQANDPLVHYHAADLRMGGSPTNHQYLKPNQPSTNVYPSSLGRLNDRYSPWGGNPQKSTDLNQFNRTIKDPGVYTSDDWNFPNGKLASIGLLGRIHRGTPWQTIYFKSEAAGLFGENGWTNQSPDIAQRFNGAIFSRTQPTNDWKLADMFTTAIDERTSRGLLSINQTNIESWSAVLSGVVVVSNSLTMPILQQPRQYTNLIIEPNGANHLTNIVNETGLGRIWKAIHDYQTNVGRPLQSVGDLLQVPELTVRSPYLNTDAGNPQPNQVSYGIDDFAYEQIPQQILSLLRIGQSRFVIYAYGQSLKPAQIDPGSGVVLNYQVTAEYATRTVVRAEGDPAGRVRLVVESFNILPPD